MYLILQRILIQITLIPQTIHIHLIRYQGIKEEFVRRTVLNGEIYLHIQEEKNQMMKNEIFLYLLEN